MKLEIDFSKPEELRRTKRELEAALSTVDAALAAIDRSSEAERQTLPLGLPLNGGGRGDEVDAAVRNEVVAMINALPIEFNMRQAKTAAESLEIPDWRLRRTLDELVESSAIRILQRGQGRRPTLYRKGH